MLPENKFRRAVWFNGLGVVALIWISLWYRRVCQQCPGNKVSWKLRCPGLADKGQILVLNQSQGRETQSDSQLLSNIWQFLKKLNSYHMTLGICLREPKTGICTIICTWSFTAALLKTAKKQKQSRCPPSNKRIHKTWTIPYKAIVFNHKKEWNTDTCTTQMNTANTTLSKRHKWPHTVCFHIHGMFRIGKSMEKGSRWVVARAWE